MTPQTEPTPIAEPVPIDLAQVATVLEALQRKHDALPLDEDLATPKAIEANYVRRSLLRDTGSRLRMDAQRVREVEPTLVMLRDWISTLESCQRDLTAQLVKAETEATHSLRAERLTTRLRQSLTDVSNGPDLVHGGEFMTDILQQWFATYHVTPLPGETGIFAGRGGLHSATARHADCLRLLALAQADLERSLHAAQQLIA